MRELGAYVGKEAGYTDASRTSVSAGRIRDIVQLRKKGSGEAIEDPRDTKIREIPSVGSSPLLNADLKAVPGPVVAAIPKPVIVSDVFVSTVESSYPEQTGGVVRYSGNILHIEPFDKPFYRFKPITFVTGNAPMSQVQAMLHLPVERRNELVRIGLGYEGIANAADRFADKHKLSYGGIMKILIEPTIFPKTAYNDNWGLTGKRAQQVINFSGPAGVQIVPVGRRQGQGHDVFTPGIVDGFGGFATHHGYYRLKPSSLDNTSAPGSSELKSEPKTNDYVMIRLPWRIDFDVTFYGTWVENPDTGEPYWFATGGYSYATRFFVGPGDVTA